MSFLCTWCKTQVSDYGLSQTLWLHYYYSSLCQLGYSHTGTSVLKHIKVASALRFCIYVSSAPNSLPPYLSSSDFSCHSNSNQTKLLQWRLSCLLYIPKPCNFFNSSCFIAFIIVWNQLVYLWIYLLSYWSGLPTRFLEREGTLIWALGFLV